MTHPSTRTWPILIGLLVVAAGFAALVQFTKGGAPEPDFDELYDVMGKSDDGTCHRSAFMSAARELIRERACRMHHFREAGGFTKSTDRSTKEREVYFVHCGSTNADRWYVELPRDCGDAPYRLYQ